ncbi:tetratricopeptide repeat protein [Desulfococcus multivorans]|uniref:Uncharacterized protein n=1 Tax=Desulfococcus multivorans DSM 2059 TaxID=1121405 RepID=S7TGZ3_DESML|nr:tetratricopeptide repeat protein [Desulfococcus multivorans]AOY60088.1 tetratricopeptide repeat domain protein [Desulfococcus multivorans]AQV02225.1 hypothetical protein B2D07_16610 [Desulfococcus multivorans]EPR36081.1 hypothetical protein dsmv_0786 [Desulfococcus multivorans DSM 2059]SJZ38057.1 hypothetical protein SAMN02745446_00306 [Desulfococcus multivorans DSM 2059]
MNSAATPPQQGTRLAAVALVICLAVGGTAVLAARLTAQLHRLRGERFLLSEAHPEAAAAFAAALGRLSRDADLHRLLGRARFRQATAPPEDPQASPDPGPLLIKARDAFLEAARLNPLDAQSFFGAAECEALLAQAFRAEHPYAPDIPYDPRPYFEAAVRLRPNGITYAYALIRYLAWLPDPEALSRAVRDLAAVYPPIHARLKKEAFWSQSLREACLQGLTTAAKNRVLPRETHAALSTFMAEEGRWSEAVTHYQAAMAVGPSQNTSTHQYHLGSLHLGAGEPGAARDAFLEGLRQSRDRERDLNRILGYYRREKNPAGFVAFFRTAAAQTALPPEADMILAQALISTERYDAAREVLSTLIRQKPMARAYYWLARTAEAQQDWDAMELAAQKATILEPENSRYHALFAQVLTRLKKYDRAKQARALAKHYSHRP